MATTHSFFLKGTIFKNIDTFTIDKKNHTELFHQLHTVLRVRVGMHIYILNNEGARALCVIQSVEKSLLVLEISSIETRKITKKKTIYLPIVKPSVLEDILRRVTEIGITHIQLWKADHSNETYTKKISTSHWQTRALTIIQEAAEQSEHFYMPLCDFTPVSLSELPLNEHSLVLLERSNETKKTPSSLDSFLIGPEGGFSKEEKNYLESSTVTSISFPDMILKAETAATVGAAMICLGLHT